MRLTTDATLHYIDSDMSNDNINGALSRDASRDVVKSVERTLQEEIDNATRVSGRTVSSMSLYVSADRKGTVMYVGP